MNGPIEDVREPVADAERVTVRGRMDRLPDTNGGGCSSYVID